MNYFCVEAKMENLNRARDFVLDQVKSKKVISKKNQNEIMMICEEVLMNVIHYAYGQSTGTMCVGCHFNRDTNELFLEFSDAGFAFNPLSKRNPDTTLDIMDRPIGGLGIYMIKQIVDEIDYERKNNQNILSIKKKIE